MKVNQFPDRLIELNNKEYLYFGGTAYLGMPTNPEFQQLVIKNILRWGSAYGSSRSANIQLTAYERGESFLAKYIQSEATVTVSSGMLAAKLVIEELIPQTDMFFHFPNIHAALKTANSLPVFIGNEINPRLLDNTYERITLLTDAVPSFHIKAIDLSVINLITSNKEITLVLDESHSLGILGNNGCGIFSTIQHKNIKRKIMVASLGKAMGVSGGVIASDHSFIHQMMMNDSFISSACMNPALAEATGEAEEIYKKQHLKLKDNLNHVSSLLANNELLDFNADYPVIYPEIDGINEKLLSNKIILTNFKYTAGAKDLNRIIFTANHQQEDLNKLISVLNQYQF
ncbi:aminotransferase class I/II-fold pyridoxal phosphate-dependent enzyme [Flavobacterium acetivorans]|uniref:aminotransferase class I/II-fold pyridoxal phosphate-dependent enzyme n=1 Tax=Flavobacterium acetivorans TaxID=2893883 RepID=UPI001E4AF018|nr:aminotransferase class I/II-fold pyridoxal phosphate-dependent enzyme [Flavobacterium sp. F-29]UFH34013.1 aminotransferase class I/II-fold pyridoxal phosphate-dependent enzyme [Flavobacterium sp. F-29]